jgi:hypothetical protein
MKKIALYIAGTALALVGGIAVGHGAGVHEERSADITVMSCSAWADTSNPVIPPHTFSGACSLPDGTLSTPATADSIPRCAAKDYNSTHVPLCYGTDTTTGKVFVLNAQDQRQS